MNYRLTHTLVGIVTVALISAAIAFSFVVTAYNRAGAEAPESRSAIPTIGHPVDDSMADCARCHVPGQDGLPPSHATYGAATCLTCHPVAEASPLEDEGAASTALPAGTQSPEATAPAAAGQATEGPQEAQAGPVPHPAVESYVNCVDCHAIGGNLSMPQDHAGYTNEVCTGCHTGPAAEATGGGVGPSVPHEVTGSYANCEACHAPDTGHLAVPENHAGFTTETCTNWHKG